MKSFATASPKVGRDKKPYLSDEVELIQFNKLVAKKYYKYRLIGGISSYSEHWMDIIKKDGNKVSIQKICLNYNPETETYDDNGCPYCDGGQRVSQTYLSNVIDRAEQKKEPAKKPKLRATETVRHKTGKVGTVRYKEFGSDSWTPCKVLRAPASLGENLKNLSQLNQYTIKGEDKTFDLSHPRYGKDLQIAYDADAAGPAKYQVQLGEKTPLQEDELDYLLYRLDTCKALVPESLDVATKEWESLKQKLVKKTEDVAPEKPKKKSKVTANEVDLEDDDYYAKPKTKKKPTSFELDDEPAPKTKKKKVLKSATPVVKKKKKRIV